MKRAQFLLLLPVALAVAACTSWFTVDGYEASWSDVPTDIERHPHYAYHGTNVYEVGGRYYRRYNDRWVVYREMPRDLKREAAERREERREEERREERHDRR